MARTATAASSPAQPVAAASTGTHRAGGVLGNARAFQRDPLRLLMDAHEACGDVARIPLVGSQAIYSLRHPDAIHRVLVENSDNYIKGRSYAWFRRAVGIGMLTADGAESRWRRTSIGPAFGRAQIEERLPLIVGAVERTSGEWDAAAGRAVDLNRDMSDLTLRIIGHILFDVDLTTAEHGDLRRVFLVAPQTVRKLIGSVSQFVPALPTPTNRAVNRQRKLLDRELDRMLDLRVQRGVMGQTDLVARMLRLRDGSERVNAPRTYRTRQELREEIITLLGAGHETTATQLASTWLHLAQHPDVERRLHEELDSVLAGRAPEAADLPRLPYLGQVLDESLRLTPPAWGILREAVADDVVTGVPVPAGALVIVSPVITQRDPRWYPDPELFRPERHAAEGHGSRPRQAQVAFGAGPRACIGKLLADVEARVTMALLAQRFRLTLPAGATVEYETSITYQPRAGTRMLVERR